jgi:hypothetical protein
VFLPFGHFCDYSPHRYYASQNHARTIYKDSTVANNYIVGNNNTIVNQGVGFDRVAKVTRGDVRQVTLKGTTAVRDLGPRRERLETDGKTLTIVRPTRTSARIPAPEKPITALSALTSKVQAEPPGSTKAGAAVRGSLTDAAGSSSSSSGKTMKFSTRQPASASVPTVYGGDARLAATSENADVGSSPKGGGLRVAKPSSLANTKVPDQTTYSDASVPAGSIIMKPTGPSLRSGRGSSAASVPPWVENPQPAAKTPVAPGKPSALARSESAPTFTRPDASRAPAFRAPEPSQPRRMNPPSHSPPPSASPRFQAAPSAPAPAPPSAAPRGESGRPYTAPHSTPSYSGKAGSSSPSPSSKSSSSDSRGSK